MSVLEIIVVTILAGAVLVFSFFKWKHSYWKRRGVQELSPEFFFGDVRHMFFGGQSIADASYNYYTRFKALGVDYGGIYTLWRPTFVPISPEILKEILVKSFDYFTGHFNDDRDNLLAKNLFNLSGEEWRQTRKQLTPTFTSGKMKMMFETLVEKIPGLQNLITEAAEARESVNIKRIVERFTIDVIGICGFGVDCNAMTDGKNSDFVHYGLKIFETPSRLDGILETFARFFRINWSRKFLTEIDDFFRNLVTRTVDYREKNNIFRKDFLHLLIQIKNRGIVSDDGRIFGDENKQGGKFSDLDFLAAQCLFFFIAGYETSATTMSFAILELAQNQDMQDKVRDEIRRIHKKYNGNISYEAVMELTYTEQVINETLRINPPLGLLPRLCTKDFKLPGTDTVIQKGTDILIPVMGIHRDPEYFPDPLKFDPERFSPENKKNIKDFTYLPFGEGPRLCLGLRFGMMQSKLGLAMLLKDHKFTVSEKMSLPVTLERDVFITTVTGGVWVDVHSI